MSIILGMVIALIFVAILAVAGYAMRLFRIEKLHPTEYPSVGLPEGSSQGELPEEVYYNAYSNEAEEEQGKEDEQELVDLFSYFNEDGEKTGEGEAEAEAEADPQDEESLKPSIREIPDYDRLSNMKTGRSYLQDCQGYLDDAKERDIMYAAAYFDIDRFRFINSLKSYSIGDYILTRIAQELEKFFPETAQFSRISADHFVAVFPVMGDSILSEYSESLRRICEKIRVDVGLKSSLRICMGLALTENAETDYVAPVLIEKANIARHCLKNSRTASHQVYDDNMVTSHLYGESAMEDYSENQYGDEILLYFQPMADIPKSKIIGCEVLARWACEDDGNGELLPTSDTGRLPTNGTKIIYHACREMSRWRKGGKELLPACIALSSVDFFKEDIDAFLGKCLSEFQLEPDTLWVNIDIHTILINAEIAVRQIGKIKDMGVKIGISGMEVCFEALDFLQNLEVDFVKINKSFLLGLGTNDTCGELIGHLVDMAEAYHVTAVFEGVEGQEQMNLLSPLGVQVVQGRYGGRPDQAEDFMRSLPEYFQQRESYKRMNNGTVILDDTDLRTGEYRIF